ncbi:hypothetical protein [Paraglaciecola sp.]|uniref:hypothetical protein n=1 Tax=Paraglaciecola sp. TaxID=1920173 RepID=UPI0030F432F5
MFKRHALYALLLLAPWAQAAAINGQMESGLEVRLFDHNTAQAEENWSTYVEPQFNYDRDDDSFSGRFFARWDNAEASRRHLDIRELSWLHVSDKMDLRLGISRVFWGVTESQHLVDIINQTDLVENPDGEDKLGQPMVQWTYALPEGVIEIYALAGFRTRRFPGADEHFSPAPDITAQPAQFEASNGKERIDLALRYSITLANFDFALSHFSGTNRTPILSSDYSGPYYPLLEQTGLVGQYVQGDWLWKLELVSAYQQGQRHSASTFGFEYTHVGVLASQYDLGWLLEYSFDDRGTAGPALLEHDWFAGWRLAFNDSGSSEALLGMIWDPQSEDASLSIEASTRYTDNLKFSLEGRYYRSDADNLLSKQGYLRNDSYVQLQLAYYF